jgi:hypothetical protein
VVTSLRKLLASFRSLRQNPRRAMRGLALPRSLNHIGKLGELVAGQLQRKYIEERCH